MFILGLVYLGCVLFWIINPVDLGFWLRFTIWVNLIPPMLMIWLGMKDWPNHVINP